VKWPYYIHTLLRIPFVSRYSSWALAQSSLLRRQDTQPYIRNDTLKPFASNTALTVQLSTKLAVIWLVIMNLNAKPKKYIQHFVHRNWNIKYLDNIIKKQHFIFFLIDFPAQPQRCHTGYKYLTNTSQCIMRSSVSADVAGLATFEAWVSGLPCYLAT